MINSYIADKVFLRSYLRSNQITTHYTKLRLCVNLCKVSISVVMMQCLFFLFLPFKASQQQGKEDICLIHPMLVYNSFIGQAQVSSHHHADALCCWSHVIQPWFAIASSHVNSVCIYTSEPSRTRSLDHAVAHVHVRLPSEAWPHGDPTLPEKGWTYSGETAQDRAVPDRSFGPGQPA